MAIPAVTVFNAEMERTFKDVMGQYYLAPPGPFERFTSMKQAQGRIEIIPYLGPPPMMARYTGERRPGTIAPILYSLEMDEFDKEMVVPTRDIKDDKAGVYISMYRDFLYEAGKPFESRLVMQAMANGRNMVAYDGSLFFATTHNQGGVSSVNSGLPPGSQWSGAGNLLTYTSAANSDASVRWLVMTIADGNMGWKPWVFWNRMNPDFHTNAGEFNMYEAKELKYLVDRECAVQTTLWWNAIMVKIVNTPTQIDLQNVIDGLRTQFYSFYGPKQSRSPEQRMHEYREFTAENTTIICSTNLHAALQHVQKVAPVSLTVPGLDTGVAANNLYQGTFALINNHYLDGLT